MELSTADLTPLPDPDATLRRVLTKLQACNVAARKELDWFGQTEAINDARRLVAHHSNLLTSLTIHELVQAAAPAVDQLRSCTSRSAMQLFGEMFAALGPRMDRELDDIVPLLIKKAGDVSTAGRDNFLGQEADRSLSSMCRSCTEARSLQALLACTGARSTAARSKVAAHLDSMLDGGGCRSTWLANWQLLDRLFKAAAAFVEEGSLEARTHGKRLLFEIRAATPARPDWERLLAGLKLEALKRKVVDVLEAPGGPPPPPASRCKMGSRLASRGSAGSPASPASLGSPPSSSGGPRSTPGPAARALFASTSGGSRSGASPASLGGPVASSPGGSTAVPNLVRGAATASGPGSLAPMDGRSAGGGPSFRRRQLSPKGSFVKASGGAAQQPGPNGGAAMSAELSEAVDQVVAHMASKDWRERCDALRALAALAPAAPALSDAAVEALLGGLGARLGDGNAKVQQQALETLAALLPATGERSATSLGSLVPLLASALGSTQDRLRAIAQVALDALSSAGPDPGLLLQHYSHVVCGSSGRGRAALVDKMAELVPQVYSSRPQLVARHAVPACLSLLHEARADMRAANTRLLSALTGLMGQAALMEHVGGLPSAASQQRARELLGGMGR